MRSCTGVSKCVVELAADAAARLRADVHGVLPASACRETPPLNLANWLADWPAKPVRWRMEGPRARTTIRLMSCTHHPHSGFSKAWAQHRDARG